MINRDFLEPITYENIHELKPGDWIWDNRRINRRAHERSLGSDKTVVEPIGFRQIDILDLKEFGTLWNNQPFMLSTFDKANGSEWVYFSECRFYKFKDELIDKIAGFFESDDNWSALKNCWLKNGRSADLRALLRRVMSSDNETEMKKALERGM